MKKVQKILYNYIMPVLLLLYPLLMADQGADMTDTTYSLGNYMFFGHLTGSWKYATFLANLLGRGLMVLTGGAMLRMNLAIGLLLSAIACMLYYYLRRIMPEPVVFAGEIIALGLCWCPVAILYNYLTYLLLTGAVVLLLTALTKERKWMLLPAGFLLGLNIMVRIPNVTQAALILVVWYDCRRKRSRNAAAQTAICILGYLLGAGAGAAAAVMDGGFEGMKAMLQWLTGLLTASEDAGGYSLPVMLGTILDNYAGNLKWLLGMAAGVLLGIGGFAIGKGRFLKVKKTGYLICVLLLFVFFYRNGMFSNQYYNVGSIWGPAVTFTMLSMLMSLLVCISPAYSPDMKRLAVTNLVLLLILPLGSNNHVYSVINYLFLAAPFTLEAARLWLTEKKASFYCFPVKAMAAVFVIILVAQTCLFHSTYVFRDGVNAEKRDAVLTLESPLKGMHTSQEHAAALESLQIHLTETAKNLVLYGNLPGLSYFLKLPAAISTSWPDLDSYRAEDFAKELQQLDGAGKIAVILPADYEWNPAKEKDKMMQEFMERNNYQEEFVNAEYRVLTTASCRE